MLPLTPERQAMASIPAAVAIAKSVATRFRSRRPNCAAQFESDALLGLVQAAGSFPKPWPVDINEFGPYVYVCSYRAILETLRSECAMCRNGGKAEQQFPIGPEDGQEMELPQESEPVGFEAWADDSFEWLVGQLPQTLRDPVRWYFADGMTYEEIGLKLGVGISRVKQMLSEQALPHLRRLFLRKGAELPHPEYE